METVAVSPTPEASIEVSNPSRIFHAVRFEAIRHRPEFLILTSKQQKFLEVLFRSGNAVQAVLAAYKSKSNEHARLFSYELLKSPRINAVVELYEGTVPLDSFLADLSKKIRQALHAGGRLSVADVQLIATYVELQQLKLTEDCTNWGRRVRVPQGVDGLLNRGGAATQAPATSEPAPHVFKAGDICIQNETKYRVTRVDESGRVLDAVEVE